MGDVVRVVGKLVDEVVDLVHERRHEGEADRHEEAEREQVGDRRRGAAALEPRRRWSHSTAGLSASARKSEITIQVRTCRAIQITSSTTATEMMMTSSDRTVRSRNRTRRSGITPRSIAQRSDGLGRDGLRFRALAGVAQW